MVDSDKFSWFGGGMGICTVLNTLKNRLIAKKNNQVMGFTSALYYPTIDIEDGWAKSAALFWDNIQTIVPDSMRVPYDGRVTQILFDEGILTPHFVNPDYHIVNSLAKDVNNFLETNEGFDLLIKGGNNAIHDEKLPRGVNEFLRIHPGKLPDMIRDLLDEHISDESWIMMDNRFTSYYMTLLANKICEHERLVLLTDNTLASNLTDKSRLDNQRKVLPRGGHWRSDDRENSTLNLSQGLLSNLILKGIRFSPDSKTEKILKFKKNHQDELGLFRNTLEKLVSDIPDDLPFETLQRNVEDIYINEFKPAYHNFQKALDGFGLKWVNDHIMKVAFFKGGTGALMPYLLGATIPQALLAGAGISIVTSAISYNQEKAQMLRENPYSYLVSAEKELNREDLKTALRNKVF